MTTMNKVNKQSETNAPCGLQWIVIEQLKTHPSIIPYKHYPIIGERIVMVDSKGFQNFYFFLLCSIFSTAKQTSTQSTKVMIDFTS